MHDDTAFARAFERGDIAPADFHHADHLRLALAYLRECGSVEEATARMAGALRRFAASAGHPEKYHHTLTVFWIRSVAALLDKDLPFQHYSRSTLFSEAARVGWVEPDLHDVSSSRSVDSSRHAPDWAVPR